MASPETKATGSGWSVGDRIAAYFWIIVATAMVLGTVGFFIYAWLFPGDLTKTAWYKCFYQRMHELGLRLDDHSVPDEDRINVLLWCDEQIRHGRTFGG
jgi:hypothetical protein